MVPDRQQADHPMIMGGIGLVSRTDIRLEVASYRCRAAGNHSVRLLAVSAIKQLCIVSVDLVWAIRPDCVRCRTLIGRAVIGLESCFSRVLPSALPRVVASMYVFLRTCVRRNTYLQVS